MPSPHNRILFPNLDFKVHDYAVCLGLPDLQLTFVTAYINILLSSHHVRVSLPLNLYDIKSFIYRLNLGIYYIILQIAFRPLIFFFSVTARRASNFQVARLPCSQIWL